MICIFDHEMGAVILSWINYAKITQIKNKIMFKLIYIFVIVILCISISKGNREELGKNYDQCVIQCHGNVAQLDITPLKFNELSNSVAEYVFKCAKIQDTAFTGKNTNVEVFPNLEGDILVIIGMRNKTTKNFVRILINMNKEYEIILKNEKVDENLKNDFKIFIKSMTKKP
jgi:hypothetical protein